MHASAPKSERWLMPLEAVEVKVRLKKSAIYALMKEGRFPQCVKLGPRAVAWSSEEVERWIDERIRASRQPFNSGCTP
jgi:prophage regulatory protein